MHGVNYIKKDQLPCNGNVTTFYITNFPKIKKDLGLRFLDVENHEQLEYMDWKIQVKRKHYDIQAGGIGKDKRRTLDKQIAKENNTINM